MKIRFTITIDDSFFDFYVDWKSSHIPQVGNIIEVNNFLNEEQRENAKQTKLLVYGILGMHTNVTLHSLLVDNYSTSVKNVIWSDYELVEIELHRKHIERAKILYLGTENL